MTRNAASLIALLVVSVVVLSSWILSDYYATHNLMPNPERLGYTFEDAGYVGSMDCPDSKVAHLAQMRFWKKDEHHYAIQWTFDGKVLAVVFVNDHYKAYIDPGFTGRYTATDEGVSPTDKSASDYYKMIPACYCGKFWFTGGLHGGRA